MKTETIKATELKAGDVIYMEYGDEGNHVDGTVIETYQDKWAGLVIKFMYNDGTDRIRECCPDRNGMIDRVILEERKEEKEMNIEEKAKELKSLKAMLDELKDEIATIEDQIKAYMGDQEMIRVGDLKITHKTVKSSRFDSKALSAELPELAARYTVPTEYKRFTIA